MDHRYHHDAERHRRLEDEGTLEPVRHLDRDGVARAQAERVKRAGEGEAAAMHLRDVGRAGARVGVEDQERVAVLRCAVPHLVGECAGLVTPLFVVAPPQRSEIFAPVHFVAP